MWRRGNGAAQESGLLDLFWYLIKKPNQFCITYINHRRSDMKKSFLQMGMRQHAKSETQACSIRIYLITFYFDFIIHLEITVFIIDSTRAHLMETKFFGFLYKCGFMNHHPLFYSSARTFLVRGGFDSF